MPDIYHCSKCNKPVQTETLSIAKKNGRQTAEGTDLFSVGALHVYTCSHCGTKGGFWNFFFHTAIAVSDGIPLVKEDRLLAALAEWQANRIGFSQIESILRTEKEQDHGIESS